MKKFIFFSLMCFVVCLAQAVTFKVPDFIAAQITELFLLSPKQAGSMFAREITALNVMLISTLMVGVLMVRKEVMVRV